MRAPGFCRLQNCGFKCPAATLVSGTSDSSRLPCDRDNLVNLALVSQCAAP